MEFSFLGGAYEVGASCILLRMDNKNILLDSGIRQGASKDPLPDFRGIQEQGGVDAIIVSHAHLDHIGTLPIISKEYPNARIYMNNMTKDLLKVLLYDSLKIMNNRESEIPLYAERDVENMLDRIFTLNYQVEFPIFEDIKITLYNAGHIAGAACTYIKGKEGAVFYSGDFSIFPQKSIDGAKIPKLRPDAAIFESTYGDKLHSNREIEEEKLIKLVSKCIENKGKMLVPAFALGRAQEVLLILKKAMNKKIIKNIPVYVDGMVRNINVMYKLNPIYLKNTLGKKILRGIEPFYDDNIKPVADRKEREEIINSNESCIIVSSSGMLTGGPSQQYAEKIAEMEKGYIVITGYQDEEAPGKKLMNLCDQPEDNRVIDINGKIIKVKCKVEKVGLSAHGDKGEIKALVDLLSPKNIFLVHGNEKVIKSLAGEIAEDRIANIFTPKSGENYKVVIKNPRKQLRKIIPYAMKKGETFNPSNVKDLWCFIRNNYEDKFFTIEELIYIWHGINKRTNSYIEKVQKVILKSAYFETDSRRLFLFKAKTEEEVEEALKPRELKPNELNELIEKYFKDFSYKKASLKLDMKKIILNFDFPRAVDNSIGLKMNEFKNIWGWEVEINETLNNNAAENLIRSILKNADIKKISYMLSEGVIVACLNDNYKVTDEKDKFKEITGIELKIQTPENKDTNIKRKIEFTSQNKIKIEQNEAIRFIDNSFREEEFRPYKKSIKNNTDGKYIELSFVSPEVGKRYEEKIKSLSNITGWDMAISNSVNQNEIINLAVRLCNEEGVTLKKNPSFNPLNLNVTLKTESKDDTALNKIKEEYDYKTGCSLIF